MSEMNTDITVDRQENGLTYYSIPAPQPAKDREITLPDPLADLDAEPEKPVVKELETQTSDAEDGGVYTRGVLAGVRKKRGKTDPSLSTNAVVIMQNSKHFAGLKWNELSDAPVIYPVTDAEGNEIIGTRLPWDDDSVTLPRGITDTDYALLSGWLENITHVHFRKDTIKEAIVLYAVKNGKVNALREYFDSLPAWDGTPRVDTLFVKYLGCTSQPEDYVATVTRLTLCSAYMRATIQPGYKYDQSTIISGAQGIGKTSIFYYLTRNIGSKTKAIAAKAIAEHPYVYSDFDINNISDKDELMKLNARLFVEMDEFDKIVSKGRVSARKIKSFISGTSDIYRAPYSTAPATHLRTWVFVGSCNSDTYLSDPTGNRRYLPIKSSCPENNNPCGPWKLNPEEIDQIWAEVKHMADVDHISLDINTYSDNIKKEWRDALSGAYEEDPRTGAIEYYLDMYLPTDWDTMTPAQRAIYINNYGGSQVYSGAVKKRDKVCLLEIAERLGYSVDGGHMNKAVEADVMRIMAGIDGWHKGSERAYFGHWGRTRQWWYRDAK